MILGPKSIRVTGQVIMDNVSFGGGLYWCKQVSIIKVPYWNGWWRYYSETGAAILDIRINRKHDPLDTVPDETRVELRFTDKAASETRLLVAIGTDNVSEITEASGEHDIIEVKILESVPWNNVGHVPYLNILRDQTTGHLLKDPKTGHLFKGFNGVSVSFGGELDHRLQVTGLNYQDGKTTIGKWGQDDTYIPLYKVSDTHYFRHNNMLPYPSYIMGWDGLFLIGEVWTFYSTLCFAPLKRGQFIASKWTSATLFGNYAYAETQTSPDAYSGLHTILGEGEQWSGEPEPEDAMKNHSVRVTGYRGN